MSWLTRTVDPLVFVSNWLALLTPGGVFVAELCADAITGIVIKASVSVVEITPKVLMVSYFVLKCCWRLSEMLSRDGCDR